jgi:two-component system, chemotaxis family, protein-glutamate methylesterase/glutaminase
MPNDFASSILIVQHMPEGFTEMFARRLDACCALEVQEARSGDLLLAGRVLICPGNRHMMVRRMPKGDVVILFDGSPVNLHRPSVDVLFHSLAQEFGILTVGVLMTGMGEDGAEGLRAIQAAGGMTIAQSEESCVVSGMPRAAISKGYANKVIALDGIAPFLASHFGAERAATDKSESRESKESEANQEKKESQELQDSNDKTTIMSQRS